MPWGGKVSGTGFMLNRHPCDLVLQENLYIMFSLRGLFNLLLDIIKVIDSRFRKQFIIILKSFFTESNLVIMCLYVANAIGL